MKTRFNYVSNSSSSSFILMETPAIAGLTGKDWNEMIVSLYEDYGKRMEECRKFEKEWGAESSKYPIFCAFDMMTDRDEAERELMTLLDGWKSLFSVMHNGILEKRDTDAEEEWDDFCGKVEREIEREHEKDCDYVTAYINPARRRDIRDEDYCEVTIERNGKLERKPLDEKWMKLLEEKWDEIGICTNADVLKSDLARFVVHFDENEFCNLKGVLDRTGEWETEDCTYMRLCEVFGKWLVEHGRVPKDFNWRVLFDSTLTMNMHEG